MAFPENDQNSGEAGAPRLSRVKWLAGACIAVALAGMGYFYFVSSATNHGNSSSHAAHSAPEEIAPAGAPGKPAKQLWVCPMHPDVIRDQPDVCPICGMDLVEMVQPGTSQPGHSHGIQIDTASQQRLGVRLATAKQQTLSQDIHAYGNVAADDRLVFNLSAKTEGVIKKLHVNSVGQYVKEDQPLYDLYSPELLKLQIEFVELLEFNDIIMWPPGAPDPHATAEGMSESDMIEMMMNAKKRNLITEKFFYDNLDRAFIDELYSTYKPIEVVTVRAHKPGFITKLDIQEGNTIKPSQNLISFVDLSQVWVDIPLYPDQLAWVKNRDEVTVILPQSNMPEIRTRLQLVTPLVNSPSRTTLARLSLDNTGMQLPLGTYLDVIIHAKPHKALAVPRSAVMHTGKGDWVMLSSGEGHFTPVKVETGIESDDFIEIIAGLQDNDQVAVNGQFLLDAAASMSDAAHRMHNSQDNNSH